MAGKRHAGSEYGDIVGSDYRCLVSAPAKLGR
jgi:hypothetical protein